MAGQIENLGAFTILNGGTSIEIVPVSAVGAPTGNKKTAFGMAVSIQIFCPAVLPETCTVQLDPLESGQTWYTLTGVTLGAGLAPSFSPGAFKSMRILAGSAVGANRTFTVAIQYDMAT